MANDLYTKAAESLRSKIKRAVKTSLYKYDTEPASKDVLDWLINRIRDKGEDILEKIFDRRKKGTVWVWKNKWELAAELHDEYFTSALIEELATELSSRAYPDTLVLGVRLNEEHRYYHKGQEMNGEKAREQLRQNKFNTPRP